MDFDFLVPMLEELPNTQLPDPSEYNYYRDAKDRIYWLDAEVDRSTLDLARKIMQWNRADESANIPVEQRQPIYLYIYSPGGDLDVCYTLVDVIRGSKTPIVGINVGQAYSSACYIFLSCHKRYCLPHAQFVVHKGSAGMSGNYAELAASFDAYKKQIEEMTAYLMETTTLTKEEIEQHMITDWWVGAEEAVANGMADGIVTALNEIQ